MPRWPHGSWDWKLVALKFLDEGVPLDVFVRQSGRTYTHVAKQVAFECYKMRDLHPGAEQITKMAYATPGWGPIKAIKAYRSPRKPEERSGG